MFASKPELEPWIHRIVMSIVRCWGDCGPDRQVGFSVTGCIPRWSVFGWCRDEGLNREATDTHWAIVQRLDGDRVQREESKRRLRK